MDTYDALKEMNRLRRLVDQLETNLAQSDAENEKLRSLIKTFGAQFRKYEKNHRAKVDVPGTNIPDTLAKAEANKCLAELAEQNS